MPPENEPINQNRDRGKERAPSRSGSLITLENITVRLGDAWLLKGLSWKIQHGENWVIWGANGAGKSTLAKALLGEAAIVQGTVRRQARGQSSEDQKLSQLAYVSSDQQIDLHRREQMLDHMRHFSGRPHETTCVGDNLNRLPSGPVDIAAMLDFDKLLQKPLNALSAGEMRKLLIGRALADSPQLLILDEPFNGLDAVSRSNLIQMLNAIALNGTQMLLITHRKEDIGKAFTHLLHLDNGRKVWSGPIGHFFKQAREQATPTSENRHPTPCQPSTKTLEAGHPLIEMRGVHVTYGDTAVLSDIHWTVKKGENWALTGPNGAGKSTLLKLITGDHLQGYANDLILFGQRKGSGESVWEIKQQIGYMADDLQLRYQKKMSGLDVVCSGFFDSVGLYRRCTKNQIAMARQWLDYTKTDHLASRPFSKLSFGQQRMLLIVRAVVKTPRLLILDEPCNGLDANNRRRLLNMLDRIVTRGLTNLLYVSHRPDEMPRCITHQIALSKGSVVSVSAIS